MNNRTMLIIAVVAVVVLFRDELEEILGIRRTVASGSVTIGGTSVDWNYAGRGGVPSYATSAPYSTGNKWTDLLNTAIITGGKAYGDYLGSKR